MQWQNGTISLDTDDGPISVEAKVRGQLAVHPMYRGDGYCISLAERGLRISWRWRVYLNEKAAITVANEMLAAADDWQPFFGDPQPEALLKTFREIHERAEKLGAFFGQQLVAPAGVLPPGGAYLVSGV